MTAPTTGYQIIEESRRVFALDADGIEICGSYQPVNHAYWQLYVSRSVSELTGLRTPPHREQFWGSEGKRDSKCWVELIAALYALGRAAA